MHTALIVGAYDWREAVLPRAEFTRRRDEVERLMAAEGLAGLIVFGSAYEHGALTWLTNFVPKMQAGFALIAPGRPVRVLAAGTPKMMDAASRLTFIEDVRPFRDPEKAIGEWLAEIEAPADARIGLWDNSVMNARVHDRVAAAVAPPRRLVDMRDAFDALRRAKSDIERSLMHEAADLLDRAAEAFGRAARTGAGARTAAIAAEHAAYDEGAQDVRVLASARDGGPPTAFDSAEDPRVDPLLAHVAVRHAGYWVEGLFTIARRRSGAEAAAGAALKAMIAAARPDVTAAEVAAAAALPPPYAAHPVAAPTVCELGLSLDPLAGGARLRAGGVYSLRVGAEGQGADNAAASAVVEITTHGCDLLWSMEAN
jgi:hypothetical protein